jgi:hypothetical protein
MLDRAGCRPARLSSDSSDAVGDRGEPDFDVHVDAGNAALAPPRRMKGRRRKKVFEGNGLT